MKLRTILAALVVMTSGSLFAQNATKADLDKLANQVNALSQKVSQLETDLERVITENVNLVEQLNVKTVTTYTDKNGIQWDIVKVEPNEEENDVVITLRLTNNSGVKKKLLLPDGKATDTNSNLSNNIYVINYEASGVELQSGVPVNIVCTIKRVPSTSSYMAELELPYFGGANTPQGFAKFKGVHIPW